MKHRGLAICPECLEWLPRYDAIEFPPPDYNRIIYTVRCGCGFFRWMSVGFRR